MKAVVKLIVDFCVLQFNTSPLYMVGYVLAISISLTGITGLLLDLDEQAHDKTLVIILLSVTATWLVMLVIGWVASNRRGQ